MHDTAIVGGGPAGAALAILLARAGRDVVLLDRSAGPHDKVCGEFLSTEALTALHALGLDPAGLGAVPITAMHVAAEAGGVDAALPFPAASLSRRRMDEALLEAAAAAGAEVRRGVAARAAGPGWVEADRSIQARHVALATGKHELRGHARATALPRWVGLKLHLRLPAGMDAVTAVHLFRGGYAGLQPIEDGWANLCLATTDPGLAAAGRDSPALLCAVAERVPGLRVLADAIPRWDRPLAVAGVPYGYLHAGPGDGVFRLGDQAAVIPSFCGDGVAIALHSAAAAAAAILAGGDAASYHAAWHRRLRPQFRRAAWLSWGASSRIGRTMFVGAARAVPALLPLAAKGTRVPRGCGVADLQISRSDQPLYRHART